MNAIQRNNRFVLQLICAHLFCLAVGVSATHFPFEAGNKWFFSYDKGVGGWGGGETESGTLSWEVVSIGEADAYPEQTRITVVEIRSLSRKVRTPSIFPNDTQEYDSTFTPPRETVDTLYFRCMGGINGLWFEGDSCWSFVFDPSEEIPEYLDVRATRALLAGDSVDGVEVDPQACRYGSLSGSGCNVPDFFTTVEGIGPVAYTMRSPDCLMDGYWSEAWSLVWANVGGVAVRPTVKHEALVPRATAKNRNGQRIYLLDGRMMGTGAGADITGVAVRVMADGRIRRIIHSMR